MLKFIDLLFKKKINFDEKKYYKWINSSKNFEKLDNLGIIPTSLLIGINDQKNQIINNTIKFAKGYKTNNALLWGVRGNGKSTLVKSIFKELSIEFNYLKLIELNKEDIGQILDIYKILNKHRNFRFIIFIDDLSFEKSDIEYKNIKSMIDGTISNQPNNIVIYVTSNRRHLMPEDMIDNEKSSAIHTHENIEEKISLSDRFGLWIGFHNLSQEDYLKIIKSYCKYFKVEITENDLKKSISWSISRGNRSGRTAWQYFLELASDKNVIIDF